ncbi:DUF4865 family protein [Streptomyces sp. 130]|uniref:DUF4865 family protein n=1 Tax=Streptomyces sp. 130 TaxID=2591006 RepID=UPI0011809483|nr:DUF4865 family protein [Streptomyces sp. 130]TRV72720.1 DUF4865 family protein [Streptomyces sp. 130]
MHATRYETAPPAGRDMGVIRHRAATGGPLRYGPGFPGVAQDSGRPAVRHRTGLPYEEGPAPSVLPRSAARHRPPVPPSASPADAVEAAREKHRLAKPPGQPYQVLHLSRPERDRTSKGRQW